MNWMTHESAVRYEPPHSRRPVRAVLSRRVLAQPAQAGEVTTLTFSIPAEWWLSANQRMHWAPKAKRTTYLRNLGAFVAVSHELDGKRLGSTHVAAFIGYLRNGTADPSNAAPTVKALIDGLTDVDVWDDDDSTHVIGPTYLRDPKSPTPGHYTVRLVLTSQDIPWLDDKERP